MNEKLQMIAEAIKADSNFLYAEGVFQCYIDNVIDESELKELLDLESFPLPKDFDSFSLREKKSYLNHIQTRIIFKDGQEDFYWYEVYNKAYFFYLADHARKNKQLTKKLINYVASYCFENINLFFLGLEYIKIQNTDITRYDSLTDYAKEKNINNLYDLLISLYSASSINKQIQELRALLSDQFKKETYFELDINYPFVMFAILVECVLSDLTRKEANTVKIKFKVLEESQLRDIDYYADEEMQNRIVNTFKKKIKTNLVLAHLAGFVLNHKKEVNSFPPNGYSAIYYYLIEEDYE